MTDYSQRTLLPEGLHDLLPPQAAFELTVVTALLDGFEAFGYEQVSAPLLEFEESLFAGPGKARAPVTFRLLDPASHRMMGLRADMTPQIARIATTRLAGEPRPLRLCYAGPVLRVKGGQSRPERAFYQAGVELIGPTGPNADAEVIALAAKCLNRLGVSGLSVDLTVPRLALALCRELELDDEQTAGARAALATRDPAALARISDAPALQGLLAAAGPAAAALAALEALALSGKAAELVDNLARVTACLNALIPDLTLTIDPGEFAGFDYKTGVGFALFAQGVRGELGRGGRYEIGGANGDGEPATGFSVYLDSLLRAVPPPKAARRLYLPAGTPADLAAGLRAEGWRTVQGLETVAEPRAEARRLGCGYVLVGDTPVALDP